MWVVVCFLFTLYSDLSCTNKAHGGFKNETHIFKKDNKKKNKNNKKKNNYDVKSFSLINQNEIINKNKSKLNKKNKKKSLNQNDLYVDTLKDSKKNQKHDNAKQDYCNTKHNCDLIADFKNKSQALNLKDKINTENKVENVSINTAKTQNELIKQRKLVKNSTCKKNDSNYKRISSSDLNEISSSQESSEVNNDNITQTTSQNIHTLMQNIHTSQPLKFCTTKSSKVNIRVGPGNRYPIAWVYTKKHFPFKIVAIFDQWYKIQEIDGTTGWVHKSTVTHKHTVITTQPTYLYNNNATSSDHIAKVEANCLFFVIGEKCGFVKVKKDNYNGWILKQNCWPV